MPVNNIQFRAEIGIFNSIFQQVRFFTKTNWYNYIFVEMLILFSMISKIRFRNLILPPVCALITLFILPILLIITICFSDTFNIYNVVATTFYLLLFSLQLITNILIYLIFNYKFIAKTLNNFKLRYFYFFSSLHFCTFYQ